MSQKIEENPDPIGDLEKTIAAQWKAQGKRLIHQCPDWDFLTICEDDKILRDKIAENLMTSIPSAIGDGPDVKIDRQTFTARPRLGREVEEQSSFIPFPLRKQVLSFEEVVSVLRNEGVPKSGIVIFIGNENDDDIRQLNFGNLKRKDVLWMLEIIKSEVLFDEN